MTDLPTTSPWGPVRDQLERRLDDLDAELQQTIAEALADDPTIVAAAVAAMSDAATRTEALSSTFADRTLPTLNNVAALDREASRTRSLVEWLDGDVFGDEFADLTAWNHINLTATGGKVYAAVGGSGRAARAVSVPATRNAIIRARVNIVPGGGVSGSANTLVGVATSAAGATPTFDQFAAAGATQDGRLALYVVALDSTLVAPLMGPTIVTGPVYVTIVVDETQISLTAATADGSQEMSYRAARSKLPSGTVPAVGVYANDGRTTAGNNVESVSFRTGLTGVAPLLQSSVGDAASAVMTVQDTNGQNLYISLPRGYKASQPIPWVFHQHGHDGSERSIVSTTGPNYNRVRQALNAAGIGVASSIQHGNNWGNQASVDDLLTLYRYVRDHFAMGPVVLTANSMGNLSTLNALARRQLPNVAGYYGIDAVTSLATMWANGAGAFAPAIRTAYGITDNSQYAAKTAGYDPLLTNPALFRGIPMRWAASTGDTVVRRVNNTDPFAAKVAPYAPEAVVVNGSGEHNSPTTVQPDDILAFVRRVTAG